MKIQKLNIILTEMAKNYIMDNYDEIIAEIGNKVNDIKIVSLEEIVNDN